MLIITSANWAMDDQNSWISIVHEDITAIRRYSFSPEQIETMVTKKLNSYLRQAIEQDNISQVTILLKEYPAVINSKHSATKNWFAFTLEKMKQHEKNPEKAITLSIIANHIITKHAQYIEQNNLEFNYSPLLLACQYNQPSVVRSLLSAGFTIHDTFGNLPSPLAWAEKNRSSDNACIPLIFGLPEHLQPEFSFSKPKSSIRISSIACICVVCCALYYLYYSTSSSKNTPNSPDEAQDAQSPKDPPVKLCSS